MMVAMVTAMMVSCRIRRNNRPNQNEKCDNAKKHIADLHKTNSPFDQPLRLRND
jgi:hypothetical protein